MATVEENTELGQQIVDDAKRYVLYSWSVQDAINPIAVAGAEGRHFWDYEGNRYLDFASQLVNVSIGHQHPRVVAAIKEQAERLATIGPPMATESRSTLGRLLAEVTPGDLSLSFFTNRGAGRRSRASRASSGSSTRTRTAAPPATPTPAPSARARRTSRRSSSTRARTPSRRSSSRRSPGRTGSSCRPTATCSRSARSATGTGSC